MNLSRRNFLQLTGLAAATLYGCAVDSEDDDPLLGDGPDVDDENPGAPRDGFDDDADVDRDDAAMQSVSELRSASPTRIDRGPAIPNNDLSRFRVRRGQFPLGVMSGDVLPTRAILCTRHDATSQIDAVVVEMDGARAVRVAYRAANVDPRRRYVRVDATGLRPGTEYRYAFLVREGDRYTGRSGLGRFRTAPADDALVPVTFGAATCNHLTGAPFPALRQAAIAKHDFFIHAGDHIYGDHGANAARRMSRSPSYAQYRRAYNDVYGEYWPVAGLKALHASTGLVSIWDDHEVQNDWDADNVDPTQLAAARRAYLDHHAIRRDPQHPTRLWRSLKWGRTLEMFVLDVRSERRSSTRLAGGQYNPDARYVSRAQMDWLKSGLRSSNAAFKVIVSSKPMAGPTPRDTRDGTDYWKAYPAQRNELLDFITRQRLEGVWVVTGDIHVGKVQRLDPDGPRSNLREVATGPAGSGTPEPQRNFTTPRGQVDALIAQHNYTQFHLDPRAMTFEVGFIGARGETLFERRYPA